MHPPSNNASTDELAICIHYYDNTTGMANHHQYAQSKVSVYTFNKHMVTQVYTDAYN